MYFFSAKAMGCMLAGRFNPDRPYLVQGPTGIIQTSNSTYKGKQIVYTGLGHGTFSYSIGALNAPPEPQSPPSPPAIDG